VLERLGARDEIERAPDDPVELERGEARFVLTVDRFAPEVAIVEEPVSEPGQLALFDALPTTPTVRGYRLPELVPAAGRAAAPCSPSFVFRAGAVRALLVPVLRGTCRRPARGT